MKSGAAEGVDISAQPSSDSKGMTLKLEMGNPGNAGEGLWQYTCHTCPRASRVKTPGPPGIVQKGSLVRYVNDITMG